MDLEKGAKDANAFCASTSNGLREWLNGIDVDGCSEIEKLLHMKEQLLVAGERIQGLIRWNLLRFCRIFYFTFFFVVLGDSYCFVLFHINFKSVYLGELPVNSTGKVQKFVLRGREVPLAYRSSVSISLCATKELLVLRNKLTSWITFLDHGHGAPSIWNNCIWWAQVSEWLMVHFFLKKKKEYISNNLRKLIIMILRTHACLPLGW